MMPSDSIAFDRAAEYYDRTRGFPPGEEQPVAELIRRVGEMTPDSRLIEIGVGTGRIALPLAAHVRSLTGVDLARPMMQRLQAKRSGEPISLVQGDATRLPLASEVFDGAVTVHVFHLIPNREAALAELARTLRPGARLVSCWTENFHRQSWWEVWNSAIPGAEKSQTDPHDNWLDRFLTDNGWKAVSSDQVHRYSYEQTPQSFVEGLRQRLWSRTWSLTDEQIEASARATQEAINRDVADPTQPVTITAAFHVQAYTPPK
jgi:ubiquinone/menaquinone biosynthesis C-methylase UbiE